MKTFRRFLPIIWLITLLAGPVLSQAGQGPDLASLVNPLVGTDRNGNTFPSAVAPFGMMQLGPNWGNLGYFYTDTHMHGFVVNMMSGAGLGNEGDVLMTATTGPVKVDRADTDFAIDHQQESASAGYYQVRMQPWGINAEMTTTTRCGILKYTFPAGKQANILLPVSYANNTTFFSHVHYVDSQTVTGDVSSQAFSGSTNGIPVYFVMKFSTPFTSHGTWTNALVTAGSSDAAQNDSKTVIGFYGSYPAAAQPRTVEVRIGMSYVDIKGAMANLNAEIPNEGFAHCRSLAAQAWDKELDLIDVQGGTTNHRRIFYTALYHALIAPTIFDDVDGRYTGFDGKIHTISAGHKHYYATFSGWDIYRSEIPLLGIIEPERAGDMAQSLTEMAQQLGYIDRWPQLNQPGVVMNGDPLTISLAHLWNAGIRNFDMDTAYQYMWKQSQTGDPHSHIGVYQAFDEEKGGVTLNSDVSPSSALEYDLSFAALGHLAEELNKPDDANYLFGRAFQYREMYNPATGYIQAKDMKGMWDPKFGGYTEGNKDIYLWFVPHDIEGLVNLIGGAPTFDRRLDNFFDKKLYDPTNEPDLQAPFLYDYINRPWKTQHIVAETADQVFTDAPGGLAGGGNDDLGTMSAWYVLSQLGFYPVDAGIPYFEVCTPRFARAVIHLAAPHTGTQFVVAAPAATSTNEYIQSATLNGVTLDKPWFAESEILSGGTWNVQVGAQPNKSWGASPYDRPYSLSSGFTHSPPNPNRYPLILTGKESAVEWHYTTDAPAADWVKPGFDDSSWKRGPAGFGTDDEGVTPRTAWNTDDLWLRRTITLPSSYQTVELTAYHDQDLDVYFNGVLAAHVPGWTHSYDTIPVDASLSAVLHPGANVIAVHVRHAGDGRHFADVGLNALEWPSSEK
jgi:predicted alpha-1,2-mannosidase